MIMNFKKEKHAPTHQKTRNYESLNIWRVISFHHNVLLNLT